MAFRDSRLWTILRLRLRSLLWRDRVEQDLDDELRDHVERATAARVAKGESPADARRAVLRGLGTIEPLKEQLRETRRVGVIENLLRDVSYGGRLLRQNPGFTSVALLSLALGIGANTAIFQLLDALRLRSLPVSEPERLATIQIVDRDWPPGDYNSRFSDLTYPQWEQLRATRLPFSGLLAWGTQVFDLAPDGEQRFAENGIWVSGGFFDVLGVKPAAGRLFTDADDQRGCGAPGVVLSYGFWQREFGGRAGAVGDTIRVRGQPVTILGVTPAGFYGVEVGRAFDIALPLCARSYIYGGLSLDDRAEWWLGVMGRLIPGASLSQATAALETISPALFAETLPPDYGPAAAKNYVAFRLGATAGAAGFSEIRGTYSVPLWLLLGIAGLVLLMACGNLANLLLARMAAREREMAMRLAIGASRGRLVQQLLIESFLLASIGAAAGALLAPLSGRLIVSMMGDDVTHLFLNLGVNWRLVGFATALALGTCLLFGLAPAVRASQVPPGDAMKAGSRSTTGGRRQTMLRRSLVALQITISVALLSAGLLFTRSLVNLLTLDTGFRQDGILEADVDFSRLNLSGEGRAALREDLLARLRAQPLVESVATASQIPMVNISYRSFFVDGGSGAPGPVKHMVRSNRVSDRYFRTLDIRLIAGRDFETGDTAAAAVVIVNEAFARLCFGDGNPIGQTMRLEGKPEQPGKPVTIVGLVRDTKYENFREEFQPIVYFAEAQTTIGTQVKYLIRTSAPIDTLKPAIRSAIAAANPSALFHFHDFLEQLRFKVRLDRLMALLCGFFAILGAVLASVGVYGVTAYSVTARRVEIGVRLALGATRGSVIRMVLGESARLLAVGLVTGALVTSRASGVASGLLFGLEPRDPITLASAGILVAAIAVLASFLPAFRASRLDPTQALRAE